MVVKIPHSVVPYFLALAGLLEDKPFINQHYVKMNELLPFIQAKNIIYQPVVVANNVIKPIGPAYVQFTIEFARALGYVCLEHAHTSAKSIHPLTPTHVECVIQLVKMN
ncbi:MULTISPECIES: hypothetical protein [Aerococcus]|uniref:Uncharacterized protein n=1 Tax=Aerococcus tenax TaxID=3078812 RepID=A0A5N1BMR2_9LACT|nr:hypothetical protein [Aerococcus urinae]KAA9240996.1 hypothetical protein F6I34_03505 [Aerococcus urinae]MDK6370500.1 hypothetical protein [Aerococcus urinae]MDK6596828.1 hypothetical protein [Aerococcus urinae]MDK7302291.1 hypothetical protein [Aerococcus urinae]MDK7800756.1 hypothetical protein [Aerococcus urinae]